MSAPVLRILSLGAGVQSSTLYLMAVRGEFGGERPDVAIFADTQWEPRDVYDWLGELQRIGGSVIPIQRVTAGNIREHIIAKSNTTGGRFASVPWFLQMPNGEPAMGRRQCTKEYKLRPVQREVVRRLGGRPKGGAEVWIGISRDEASRMKPSRVQYIKNRWPLIERDMTRRDCLAWLSEHGYATVPKSSCIGCPFHSNAQWRSLRETPDEWADAVSVDSAIRTQSGMRGRQFMHRSMLPLAEVDLSTPEENGQVNMFENECEGLCGV